MAKDEQPKSPEETGSHDGETASAIASKGLRARKAFMLKQLVPSPDWIMKNVVAGGKGTQITVGRVYGIVTRVERKTNTLNDGKVVASIALMGAFQSESYVTDELSEAASVYLPLAYAEQVATAFENDKEMTSAEVDVDIGIEATGKTIPYEWVIIAFTEGAAVNVLRRLKGSRGRPANAPALLTDQSVSE